MTYRQVFALLNRVPDLMEIDAGGINEMGMSYHQRNSRRMTNDTI